MTHPLQLFPGLDSRFDRRCCLLRDAVAFVGGCGSLKMYKTNLVSSLTQSSWVDTAGVWVLLTQKLPDCQGPCIVIIPVIAGRCSEMPQTMSSETAAQLVE